MSAAVLVVEVSHDLLVSVEASKTGLAYSHVHKKLFKNDFELGQLGHWMFNIIYMYVK